MQNDKGECSEETKSPKHVLPIFRRLAYSIGHVLNDLCSAMWFTYLLVYLQSVLNLESKYAGILLLIGQIADGLATLFVGLQSDKKTKSWLSRYGRRKSWHLIGTICISGSFPFLFSECIGCTNSSQNVKLAYYAIFIIIFQFGWAAVQISHLSLIPDLTPISSERTELAAFRYSFTVMSNICVYLVAWLLLSSSDSKGNVINSGDAPLFRNIALFILGAGLLFSIIFHIFVKETPSLESAKNDKKEEKSDKNDKKEEKLDNTSTTHLKWKDWLKKSVFYKIGILYMGTRLYINLSQVYMPLYIQKGIHLSRESIAIIPMVVYISGFLASFFIKFCKQFLGKKVTYFIGCLIALLTSIWLLVGEQSASYHYIEIYIISVLIGITGSMLLIISLSFTSDLIGENTSSGAFVYGVFSFGDKISNGLAVLIIQDAFPCSKNCCEFCPWFYSYVLAFSGGLSAVVGLLALVTLLPSHIEAKKKQAIENGDVKKNEQTDAVVDKSVIYSTYQYENILAVSEDSEAENNITQL